MNRIAAVIGTAVIFIFIGISFCVAQISTDYQYQETKDLVSLVKNAAALIESKGEAAFPELRKEGSQWRHDKVYIFVVDTDGNMLVHPDPAFEGKNQMALKDVNGKDIIKGLIGEAAGSVNRDEGWYFYQWPEPGTIFSSWKIVFAKRSVAPSGKVYVVCCGLYNMKVEKSFIINMVNQAAALIDKDGRAAFDKLRAKSSQFVILGTYVFVDTPEGIEVVNGGFPDIEGKNIFDHKDPNGKYLTREIINIAVNQGSGWVDYLWPKPGETKPSKKLTYVKRAKYGNETFAVGAGAYIDEGLETPVTSEKIEEITGHIMVLELKSGDKASGEIIRETKDSVYLAHPDGSMEMSFPRDRIVKIRKPTEKELAKIKGILSEKEKKDSAAK